MLLDGGATASALRRQPQKMAQFSLSVSSLLLLLLVSLLHTHVTAACCTQYSTSEIPIARIKGVSIQKMYGRCNINAVIFHTIKDRQICADPNAPWVLARIKTLRDTVKKMRNLNSKK